MVLDTRDNHPLHETTIPSTRQPSPPRDNLRERLYGFVTCKSCPLTSLFRDS